MYVVYVHTNRNNDKRYIGWAVVEEGQTYHDAMMRRWKDHCYDARVGLKRLLHNALRKHGDVNWDHEVLDVTRTLEGVKHAEILWIAQRRTYAFDEGNLGYNMTRGGDGVQLFGEQNPFYGKKHKESSRARIKQKRAEQVMGPCSDDKAEKIRQSNVRTFVKLRTTGATSQRAFNVWKSRKANRIETTRPVLQYDNDIFITRHSCIIDALKSIGKDVRLYNGSITKCCEGVYRRAYGFSWRWED